MVLSKEEYTQENLEKMSDEQLLNERKEILQSIELQDKFATKVLDHGLRRNYFNAAESIGINMAKLYLIEKEIADRLVDLMKLIFDEQERESREVRKDGSLL